MFVEKKILTGLVAAPFTPFHPDGSLNLSLIDEFSPYLVKSGVKGVFVCGTTSEFASLTLSERRAIAEAWAGAAHRDGLKMILQIGDNCLANACELAAHGSQLQIDGIASLSPNYFKPKRISEMIKYLRELSDYGKGLPLFYYDIPEMIDVSFSASELLRKAIYEVPNLCGLKFSNRDLEELKRCIALESGGVNILFGCDDMLLDAHELGVDGAVGSSYNYSAPLYMKMFAAAEKGDWKMAQELQARAARLIAIVNRISPLSAGKCILKRLGFDFGPVRLPLRNLDQKEQNELQKAAHAFGSF